MTQMEGRVINVEGKVPGIGARVPVADSKTEGGRVKNCRIKIVVYKESICRCSGRRSTALWTLSSKRGGAAIAA